MNKTEIITLQKLSKVTSSIPKDLNAKQFIQSILKQAIDVTRSNLACFYKQSNFNSINNPLKIKYKIGRYDVPQIFPEKDALANFTYECNDIIVLLERKTSPFESILLNSNMNSGICFPVANKNLFLGIVFLNSIDKNFYNREKILIIESIFKLIQSTLNNLKFERKNPK